MIEIYAYDLTMSTMSTMPTLSYTYIYFFIQRAK